jgi:hypothetical protein
MCCVSVTDHTVYSVAGRNKVLRSYSHVAGNCLKVNLLYVQTAVLWINKIIDVGCLLSATLCHASGTAPWFIYLPPC